MKAKKTQPELAKKEPHPVTEIPRIGSVALLDRLLADYAFLAAQALSIHWNFQGVNFISIHDFFERRYHSLNQRMDQVAERLRALGVFAPAGFAEWAELTNLEDIPLTAFEIQETAQGPRKLHFVSPIRLYLEKERQVRDSILHTAIPRAEEVNDAVTEELLIACLKEHEQVLWILQSLIPTSEKAENQREPQKSVA